METEIEIPFTYNFNDALIRLAGDPVNKVDMEQKMVYIPTEERNIITLQSVGTMKKASFLIKGFKDEQQLQRTKEILHLDRSLDHIHDHFQATDLGPIFTQFQGMPLIQSYTLYGRLMKGIIHQQLNKTFANRLTLRFVEAFGERQGDVWFYPRPEVVANLSIEQLREMQFSERKASYVIGLSKAIAEGILQLETLRTLDNESVVQRLTEFKGIGPWTAQNFLLFGLGRENLFPLADVGLQNALKQLWQMDRKPTREEIEVHLPQWEPYLSYAALYLWKSIEVLK